MPVMDGYATMRAMRELPGGAGPADHRRHGEGRRPGSASAASTPAPPPTSPSRSTPPSCCSSSASGSRASAAGAARRPADGDHGTDRSAPTSAGGRPCSSSTTTRPSASRSGRCSRRLGHDVVEADSGRAALRAVLRQTFAVILMDVAHADPGRLRDGQADPAAHRVGAHADHLLHRLRARRDRDGHRVRQRRGRLHLHADPRRRAAGQGLGLRRPLRAVPGAAALARRRSRPSTSRCWPGSPRPPSSATTTPASTRAASAICRSRSPSASGVAELDVRTDPPRGAPARRRQDRHSRRDPRASRAS